MVHPLVQELVGRGDVDVVSPSTGRRSLVAASPKETKSCSCGHVWRHAHGVVWMVVVGCLPWVLTRHGVHAKSTSLKERVGVRRPGVEQREVRGSRSSRHVGCSFAPSCCSRVCDRSGTGRGVEHPAQERWGHVGRCFILVVGSRSWWGHTLGKGWEIEVGEAGLKHVSPTHGSLHRVHAGIARVLGACAFLLGR